MIDVATKQVIEDGIDKLTDMIQNDEKVDATELHHRLYNEDYFIIGTHKAKQFLETVDGGTFEAIEMVRGYETDNFGEFKTEINPEKIANMYAYIKGEEALNNCEHLQKEWDNGQLSEDDLIAIKAELQEQIA